MHILFVCSKNRLRSPTAAAVFSEYEGVEAISAGTNADCEQPVSGDLIEWADAVLEIPDHFEYMDPLLVKLLEARVPRYVRISEP